MKKVDNLTQPSGVFTINITPTTPIGTRFSVPFRLDNYKSLNVLAYEIYGDNTLNINGIHQAHWNLIGDRSYRYHVPSRYSVKLITDIENNELVLEYMNISPERILYINRFEVWGESPKL